MQKFTACSHERSLFIPEVRRFIIDECVNRLSMFTDEFDAFVVSGYSMAMIATSVADKLEKNIVLVRKPYERKHSMYKVEGIHGQRCFFLDDLIASGKTLERCIKAVKEINCRITHVACFHSQWQITDDPYGMAMLTQNNIAFVDMKSLIRKTADVIDETVCDSSKYRRV